MNTEEKLDKILEDLTDLKVIQERHSVLHEKNTEDLAEHIRRTAQNEEMIKSLSDDLAPIKKHVTVVETIAKNTMYVLGIVAAIIMGLEKLGILQKLF